MVYGTGAAAGEPPLNVVQSIDPATGAAMQRIMSVAEFLPLFQAKLREAPCRAVDIGVFSTCPFAVVCRSVTRNSNFVDTSETA